MQTLDRLWSGLGVHAPALPVTGITTDSREVEPGMILLVLQSQERDADRRGGARAGRRVEGEVVVIMNNAAIRMDHIHPPPASEAKWPAAPVWVPPAIRGSVPKVMGPLRREQ